LNDNIGIKHRKLDDGEWTVSTFNWWWEKINRRL